MNRSTPWVILDVISSSGSHWLVFKDIGCVLFYWLHSSQSPRLLLRTFFSSLQTTWVDLFELLNWGCLSHKLVWSVGLLLVCLWLRGNWALPSWHKGRFNCWPVLPTTTHRPVGKLSYWGDVPCAQWAEPNFPIVSNSPSDLWYSSNWNVFQLWLSYWSRCQRCSLEQQKLGRIERTSIVGQEWGCSWKFLHPAHLHPVQVEFLLLSLKTFYNWR